MDLIASRRFGIPASNILFFSLAVALVDSAWAMRRALHKLATLGTLLVGFMVLGGFYYGIRRSVTLLKWLFMLGQVATLLYTLVQYRTTLLPVLHTSVVGGTILCNVFWVTSRGHVCAPAHVAHPPSGPV